MSTFYKCYRIYIKNIHKWLTLFNKIMGQGITYKFVLKMLKQKIDKYFKNWFDISIKFDLSK